ncbi:hypothetical protein QSH18_19570 [Xanthomonas sp. NCPPB 2654]|jgi:hypothetical protein|uniref:hypothetical protein n=1 Tax=unclassified Xanthomonas TaxID=2643310 RepID=UPI0021E096F0|nr:MULTISPECIES: hypothetical protein [unclassified Xanthomonas]MDL5367810.1 hypothetical protein [Xanthomonas sp. NCPPB 2654]MDR6675544.1 hypothetical protein [Xanthomonas translucens]MEB1530921.1 hypothetical protein [Xanthomonas campestris pv. campestris]UYC21708.1 hypothetical protein NUG20_05200 [Xanthomonas sp. CFBP 8443]
MSSARPLGPRAWFQMLSYLQYPAMVAAAIYAARPLFNGMAGVFDDWNYALLYAGVGVGLSSLQDPTRTQNKISHSIWQDPRKGRLALWLLSIEALVPIVIGLVGAYLASSTPLNQLSLGLVAFGLGMVGLLKTAIEMFEHHRLDRARDPADMLIGGHA